MKTKTAAHCVGFGLLILIIGCTSSKNKDLIGSAVIETPTSQITTTVQGMLLDVMKDEGMTVQRDELVAIVDTIPLILKQNELLAAQSQLDQTIAAKKAELESQASDMEGIEREYNRIGGLADKGSVPIQQKDNLGTQLSSAKLRIKANRMTLESLYKQKKIFDAQDATLRDQIKRCYVLSSFSGTILTRYKNTGEVITPGSPIFEIGNYDTMQVDFFITQPMLPEFKMEQTVRIRIDLSGAVDGKKEQMLPARISWISNEAEFSPKNIQTRESRNELVFKIRAKVPNTGNILKRGLPVEVWR
jgi:HlyD family secretion protein